MEKTNQTGMLFEEMICISLSQAVLFLHTWPYQTNIIPGSTRTCASRSFFTNIS
ncbi:hypothetical protein [Methanoplanus limicola]|uniref:hypothetical protein n=1 Tax=Methanoplanus limicola TaxID=2315 RepID=UPI0012F6A5C4|nr:hypothetical protein [Methanoplanus limicola]